MYSKRDLNYEARRQYSQKVSRRESDFSEYIPIYSKRGVSDWNEGWKLMKICSYSIRIDIKFVRQ